MIQTLVPANRLPLAYDVERLAATEWGARRATVIIGRHELLRETLAKTVRFAQSHSPVLVTGETGTGKELFARALFLGGTHHRRSFISVNCAQYGGTELVASELFGHRKGAFTGALSDHRGIFEEADGGTVFLDEIGDLPLSAQAMLLRTLGEGEIVPVGSNRPKHVDVRVIAATSRDLKPMIADKSFRADLYYRLRQLHLQIPPLRDRGDDWNLIAGFFLDSFSQRASIEKSFSQGAMAMLQDHTWPGNVREVKSVVDTGFHLSDGATIRRSDFCEAIQELAEGQSLEVLSAALVQDCCTRMVSGDQTFWDVVHQPFLRRDLNRAQVKEIIGEGLTLARSYKKMLNMFGVMEKDYLKFMDFLRHHELKPTELRPRAAPDRTPSANESLGEAGLLT